MTTHETERVQVNGGAMADNENVVHFVAGWFGGKGINSISSLIVMEPSLYCHVQLLSMQLLTCQLKTWLATLLNRRVTSLQCSRHNVLGWSL